MKAAKEAVINGDLDKVKQLVTNYCDEGRGMVSAALDRAICEDKLNIIKWLVREAGADVEATDSQGKTALLRAAHLGHIATVKWLIKTGGSNVAIACQYGKTALLQAASNRGYDVVHWRSRWPFQEPPKEPPKEPPR